MDRQLTRGAATRSRDLSRRAVLRHTATAACAVIAGPIPGHNAVQAEGAALARGMETAGTADPVPGPAMAGLLAALKHYPLVALAERHFVQEWHDLISALLYHPDLPAQLTDIVVEVGCAAYQDLADHFIVAGRPVARADLAQIWRQVGDVWWDAPVYEQFFRTVRAVNWMRPPERRIRVLLGSAPPTVTQVLADNNQLAAFNDVVHWETYYAGVVEREVLRKGRRAILVGGAGHMLRGLYAQGDPAHLNAASQVAQRHPGQLYVVDTVVLPPGPAKDRRVRRLQSQLATGPRPALVPLAGTWLGALTQAVEDTWINWGASRAVSAAAARYEAQADAMLYLGPGELLTASRPDPAIYQWGAYPRQLRELDALEHADMVAFGQRFAQAGPSWFAPSR